MYETTLLLKGIGQAEGQVLTLSSGEQVYLSLPLAPGQERLTLYNTPAGEYSEGVLLPHLLQLSGEPGDRRGRAAALLPSGGAGGGRLIYGQGKGPQNVVLFLVSCVFSI
ncbi:MAG: hypothetical protein ACLT9P_08805 [Evtepia gabavorous]